MITLVKQVRTLLLFMLVLSACVSGPTGSPNLQPVSWDFIQSVGGIQLGEPYTIGGMRWVPVIVDLSGSQTITVTPTRRNTGLVCSTIRSDISGNQVTGMNSWITIYAEPGTKSSGRGVASQCDATPLPLDFGVGGYRVYYEENRKFMPSLNNRKNLIGTVR